MPVPQVKVGPNGEMIIDEESTVIETTAAKRAKEELLRSPLVFEASSARGSNYGTWGKRRKNVDWSERETVRFYRALSVFGTDFSMMESVFKKRSRHELKMKFKKEERSNRTLVDKCLTNCGQFDASAFHSDTEEEEDEKAKEEERKKSRRRRPPQTKGASRGKRATRGRRASSNRGYYASSDADESETGGSESDTSRRQTPLQRWRTSTRQQQQQQNQQQLAEAAQDHTVIGEEEVSIASSPHPVIDEPAVKRRRIDPRPKIPSQSKPDPPPTSTSSSPLLKTLLTESGEKSSPTPQSTVFPPSLLAANPGLANAAPGSLLVVASPSQGDPQKQMLHVYRISASGGVSDHSGGGTPKS